MVHAESLVAQLLDGDWNAGVRPSPVRAASSEPERMPACGSAQKCTRCGKRGSARSQAHVNSSLQRGPHFLLPMRARGCVGICLCGFSCTRVLDDRARVGRVGACMYVCLWRMRESVRVCVCARVLVGARACAGHYVAFKGGMFAYNGPLHYWFALMGSVLRDGCARQSGVRTPRATAFAGQLKRRKRVWPSAPVKESAKNGFAPTLSGQRTLSPFRGGRANASNGKACRRFWQFKEGIASLGQARGPGFARCDGSFWRSENHN